MKQHKFIISGGGTGGHVFPAIAIGLELQQRFPKAQTLFVGALRKMEMTQVPQAGFPIKGLWISGLQRTQPLRNILFPLKLIVSLWQSFWILIQFRPSIAIGTGGFASGSLLLMAQWLKIPTLIQEQNSFPGITNKVLAKKASKICVAYSETERFFPKEKMVLTGNPIRKDIASLNANKKRTPAKTFFNLNASRKTVAVLGGSLGAAKINSLVAAKKDWILKQGFDILWQCGKLYYDQYQSFEDEFVKVLPFITEMDTFYQTADIIISRAGASTLSELACVGKTSGVDSVSQCSRESSKA